MVVLVERLLQITPCQDQAVAVVGEKVDLVHEHVQGFRGRLESD